MHALHVIIGALAAALWPAAVTEVVARVTVGFVCIDLALAITASVIAYVHWYGRRLHDEYGKRPLVRELVDIYLDEREPRRPAYRRSF